MSWWQSIVLGLVQGLTEFFPVSSSGHLILAQYLLGVEVDSNMLLSILFHFGTLLSILIVFFHDVIDLFKQPKKLLFLLVASIPVAVVGFTLKDFVDKTFYNAQVLSLTFAFTAIVLLLVEIISKKSKLPLENFSFKTALAMGFAQTIAILPGVSRSGLSISAGILARGEKSEVAKMSFLMSIPVVGGSLLLEIKDFFDVINQGQQVFVGEWWVLILGIVVSAVSGIFAIKVMVKLIPNANFKGFSIYLFALAVALAIFI